MQDVRRVITFRPDHLAAVRRTFVLPKIDSMIEFCRSIPRWKVAQ